MIKFGQLCTAAHAIVYNQLKGSERKNKEKMSALLDFL